MMLTKQYCMVGPIGSMTSQFFYDNQWNNVTYTAISNRIKTKILMSFSLENYGKRFLMTIFKVVERFFKTCNHSANNMTNSHATFNNTVVLITRFPTAIHWVLVHLRHVLFSMLSTCPLYERFQELAHSRQRRSSRERGRADPSLKNLISRVDAVTLSQQSLKTKSKP